ncbi:MAG: zinc ribbon domain-containing protein [Planctomycetes bacterium]|nr:zinc ribbon domain-containing protein [Planctomycetota bacterium]
MPTYDYLCGNCGHKFEQFQSMTAKLLRKCPECKKMQLKRLIGAGSGVIFKGSGFYETDYRSKDYKDAQKKEKEKREKKDTKAKDETKKSKPDKKAKSTPKPNSK